MTTAPTERGPLTGLDTSVIAELIELSTAELDQISWASAATITAEVTAYGDNTDPNISAQVAHHSRTAFQALLACMRDDRWGAEEDFPATAGNAVNRVGQGVSLADFLRAFRLAQVTFWKSLVDTAREHGVDRDVLLAVATLLMQVMEIGSSVAAGAYLEAEQYRLANQDRVRRDLIEDLLAGRDPRIGPRQGLLRTAGLLPDADHVVASARVIGAEADQAVQQVSTMLRRTVRSGLVVARHRMVVAVLPAQRGIDPILAHLEGLRTATKAAGMDISIGVGTIHRGWSSIREAYQESRVALGTLGDQPGVQCLESMSALDYVMITQTATARRLIDPRISTFVEEERASGGVYLETLKAYVASDLNAKEAADRLGLHVNTAYYRLERISERTGQDLRRLPQVLNLMVAVRMLESSAEPDPRD